MPVASEAHNSAKLISHLKTVLLDLCRSPYPHVPNPPELKKRASVALIIRINPQYSHWPKPQDHLLKQTNHAARLEEYFSQDWVQAGEPEVLFIKRAARTGDRWTGHVALPGGRRDPEDADDYAAAVRETEEEVGLELTEENAIPVGNLPQRLVTASWGTTPLMILCPYIFLLTASNPTLRLQPSEVASAHWVPLRLLLDPRLRTYEAADVSSRLSSSSSSPIYTAFLRTMLGSMLFSAVHLIPTTSVYSPQSPGFNPSLGAASTSPTSISTLVQSARSLLGLTPTTQLPFLLWGLTLGVLADFLELLPPHDALSLWTYPTFSAPDVRAAVWLLSWQFRRDKAAKLEQARRGREAQEGREDEDAETEMPQMAEIEVGLDSVPLPRGRRLSTAMRSEGQTQTRLAEEAEPGYTPTRLRSLSPADRFLSRQSGADVEDAPTAVSEGLPPPLVEVGIAGLGAGTRSSESHARRQRRSSRSSRVGYMLDGYYDIMRRAVAVALVGRAAMLLALFAWVWRKWRKEKRRRLGLL